MDIIAPDRTLSFAITQPVVFLAGSIEMGKAENWQAEASKRLHAISPNVWVCNPRRKQWDNSWTQSIDNPLFAEQVNWELDHLARADIALFYFQPFTMSPITLMELGQRLGSQNAQQKTFVCCPDGFWRKGNIEVMCQRYGIVVHNSLDEVFEQVCAHFRAMRLV